MFNNVITNVILYIQSRHYTRVYHTNESHIWKNYNRYSLLDIHEILHTISTISRKYFHIQEQMDFSYVNLFDTKFCETFNFTYFQVCS